LSPLKTGTPAEALADAIEEASPRIVLFTIVATAVAAAIGQWWLSPLLLVAPMVHLFVTSGRTMKPDRLDGLTIRWAVTVLLTVLIATAFLPDQTRESVAGGAGMDASVRAWLEGTGGPAWGLLWLAVVPVVVAAATVVSDGMAGWLLYGMLTAQAAIHASVIYERGTNLVLSTLIALSPWQWAMMLGLFLLIRPMRQRSFVHFPGEATTDDPEKTRRRLMIAGALIALSLVLRLALAGPYTKLAGLWTVG
jgi:hypothetical protein